ncbi:efflux RND transporter permease subunit [Geoalkalibacter subterraneus]|uniref:efflux RND transporter permease subunit n=1 Tax=Geoalkalibacter subterraneus TaxID=483547 RepID=UPI000693CD90|nr:MMPL family transporter [Geoalkalibacter subterraneus]
MLKELVGKNCDLIFRHSRLYLAFLILLTGFFGYFYANLPVETSVESLIIENDPDLEFYESFKDQFGEDEFLVVGYESPRMFTDEFLDRIDLLTLDLENISGVREVVSITSVEDILGTETDFIVQPLVPSRPEGEQEIRHILERIERNPLIKGNVVSEDLQAGLFLIRTTGSEDDGFDARLVADVMAFFSEHPQLPEGIDFHVAGWLVTDTSMASYMNRDMAFFMPITYVLIAVLLWVFLRNLPAVTISLINISICLVWTMAFLYFAGGAMSPMTSILPPLIMALVVSDSIHILQKFLQTQGADLQKRIRDAMQRLAVPCFLTSLTTAIGFSSLGLSDIPPIRHFGFAAAGGMLVEFYLSMTLIPLGLWLWGKKRPIAAQSKTVFKGLDRISEWTGSRVTLWYKPVLAGSIAVLALFVYGATQLQVETNLLEYFRSGSEIRQDTDFVDSRLGGVNTLEISLRSDEREYFLEPQNLEKIEAISRYLQEIEVVSKTTSLVDFLKQMNQAFHADQLEHHVLPQSRQLAAQYLLLYDGDELRNFADLDYSWVRISARLTEHSSQRLNHIISDIDEYLTRTIDDPAIEVNITGKTFLVNKLVKSIVESQVKSLSTAFVVIFLVLFFVFRSFKLGCLSIIPNALPIIMNLGVMGLFGIPLNTATAIISAVALGIAVDDTIHFLTEYQHQRESGTPRAEAIRASINEKFSPILSTSLILVFGFGILVFSSFVPTVQFGFLCALIMLFAFVSDLIILPAALMVGAVRK